MNQRTSGKRDAAHGSPLAPAARAARAEVLRKHAEATWPEVYPAGDPGRGRLQAVYDAVHAAVADVPPAGLPAAVGGLLGRVAADVLVDSAVADRRSVTPSDIEQVIDRLDLAVRQRHFGD